MAIWDFVKDAGKAVFGKAEAAPAPSTPSADAAAPKADPDAETQRKVAALKAELQSLNLDAGDVHLRLRGDTVVVESRGADREVLEKLILAVGNIQGIAKVEADLPDDAPPPVFHTVTKGETLSAIAKEHLGSATQYNAIFEANRPMLSDPDKIYPGQVLRIPAKA
ncbi:peptidoglycan-binding protein LysM [Paracoccus gahaiensis]|uniref:Potassium binding protein Kbp n=1 Tax=Paracoccus gahaiensis TaxID=1706839 RepID=A0A4U0RDN1_9RHOB|nr:peptidoglycan-binding protein LysM [Paracoccus gahaiensis]TJZ93355.1 peptidoglycan-binding protein LysM [Paracoccus gahaiensis]